MEEFTTPEKAIGGGIIALIVIAAVIAVVALVVGGKKTYDYVQLKRDPNTSVHDNPLYAPQDMDINNPLYEEVKED